MKKIPSKMQAASNADDQSEFIELLAGGLPPVIARKTLTNADARTE